MSGSPFSRSWVLAGPTEAIIAAAVRSAMREAGVLCRSLLSPRPFVMTGRIPRNSRRKLERRRAMVNEAAITTWDARKSLRNAAITRRYTADDTIGLVAIMLDAAERLITASARSDVASFMVMDVM